VIAATLGGIVTRRVTPAGFLLALLLFLSTARHLRRRPEMPMPYSFQIEQPLGFQRFNPDFAYRYVPVPGITYCWPSPSTEPSAC